MLRFGAFLAVFFHHALPGFELKHHVGNVVVFLRLEMWVKEAGGFGVCLFFLLSAYLITELLERERQTIGRIHVGWFYIRRMLRIWPLYFSFLTVAVLFGMLAHSYRVEPARIWAFLLLAGNWYVASTGCGANLIAPLWSISVEEQFYLTWPWVAKRSKRLLLWSSVILLPLSWLAILVFSHKASLNRGIWVNSFVQFQFFGLGALLALALRGRVPQLKPILRMALVVSGILLWVIVSGILPIKDDSLRLSALPLIMGYALVALGCGLLFLGFLGARMSFAAPLIYLGKISYGLYVFHMLAIDLAWRIIAPQAHSEIANLGSMWRMGIRFLSVQTLAISLTVCLAMLSYRFLEYPFLRLKNRFTFVKSA